MLDITNIHKALCAQTMEENDLRKSIQYNSEVDSAMFVMVYTKWTLHIQQEK